MPRRMTTDEFIEKAKAKHGDKYDYSEVVYLGGKTQVSIICRIHGSFKQRIDIHLQGSGCKECSKYSRPKPSCRFVDEFIEKAKAKHGDKYDYSEVVYENCKKQVIIICHQHGRFLQIPDSHIQGSGCRACGIQTRAIARQSNTQEFIEKANKKHNYKYNYDKVIYINRNTEVIVTCYEHGDFEIKPSAHLRGTKCSGCTNYKIIVGKNDLATTHPELASEWHPTKNGDLTPQDVTFGSGKKVWWLGTCNHEWEACISSRTRIGANCPICCNRQVSIGYNDLATTHPELASEWHPTKNGDLTPQDVTFGSGKKVWWRCSQGHEWQSTCDNRKKRGCPICSNRQVSIGKNDLATTHPELAKQWHPTKNGDLTPQDVTYGCGKKVWWRCSQGHEWQVTVNSRTNGNSGCEQCHNIEQNWKKEDFVENFLLSLGLKETQKVKLSNFHVSKSKTIYFSKQFTHNELKMERKFKIDFSGHDEDKNINFLIEYNGEQHYKFTLRYHKKAEDFEKQLKRDEIKIERCKELNVPLLIITPRDTEEDIKTKIKSFINNPITNYGYHYELLNS